MVGGSYLIPVLLAGLAALALSIGMIVAGQLFSPRRAGAVKQMPYESGMDPIHDTRRRFDVRFYMVAIAFLIFDVELLFLYPWAASRLATPTAEPTAVVAGEGPQAAVGSSAAVGLRAAVRDRVQAESPVPVAGEQLSAMVADRLLGIFCGVMIFVVVLVLGFAYDWRKGLFQWR